MSKVLVTGGNGQLGSEIKDLEKNYPKYSFYFTDIQELDITNQQSVKVFIEKNKIEIIINCAAYTSVDKAESEFEINNQINHLAVNNFAKIAKEKNLKMIHISTDYVFDGQNYKPYVESDTVNPQSVYGETKLAGENSMLKINPKNSIIIRTSWVYSSYGNNFVKTMLRLGSEREELSVIFDQVGTPTYARDLAIVILEVLPQLDNNEVEVFHFSNEGVCSWYDFAKAIFEIKDLPVKVNPIQTFQYPTPAKRPFYSVLNKSKIKDKYKVDIPYWKESLTNCLSII
jgi:dTDP-4-dehydrorhamnose reductase